MKMKNNLFIYILLLISGIISAQPVQVSSYETMINTAVEAAEGGDYLTAIEWFGKAFEDSKDQNLQVALADMYVLLRDYPKAEKIYERVPRERLFQLLAIGGKTGTIRNWYKNDPPYIFGKTGSLNNNHVLSGYLITRKGKLLIFSLMNNNYLAPTNDVRKHMQEILYTIYTKY